jgi:formyl-CoA transferase
MGVNPQRNGNEFGFAVPANVFRLSGWLGLYCDTARCTLEGVGAYDGPRGIRDDPGFATIAGRCANRDACNAIVASWTAERGRAEVVEILNRSGIPVGPINSYGDAARDLHVLERDSLRLTLSEDGSTIPIYGPVVKFSRTPTRVRTGAPALGQHNDEILGEIGVDASSHMQLKNAGVI